jgi:hypothetical protein
MSLLRRSVHRLRPSVGQIIINSPQNPLGRITDEFDREIKTFFSNTDSVSGLVSNLLTDPSNLKIPPKIRKMVCLAITDQLGNLSSSEFGAVPDLLRKLPSLMLSTLEENNLFDSWLSELVEPSRINSFTFDQLATLIVSVKKLRLITQSTDEPIVRLFEHITSHRSSVSPQVINDMFVIVSKKFDKQSMNKIRPSLVSLVLSIDSSENMHALVQLPIFPECTSHIDNLFSASPVITPQLVVAYLMAPIKFTLPDKVDFQSVCFEVANVKQAIDAQKASQILASITSWNQMTLQQISGYMRLKSVCQDESEVNDILNHVISLPTSRQTFSIFGFALKLSPNAPSLIRFIESLSAPLTRQDIVSMFPVNVPDHLVAVCDKVLVPKVTDVLAAASLATRLATPAASEKLLTLLETSSIDQLITVEKILSRNGLVYLDGSASEPLKRTTRALFRKIRMAPIDNVK